MPVFRIDRSPRAALCRGDDDAVAETICRTRAERVQLQIYNRDIVDIIVVVVEEDRRTAGSGCSVAGGRVDGHHAICGLLLR